MKKLIFHIISIPFIWMPLIAAIPMHICIAIYQAVAFPLYGLEPVKLMSYINFDREKLSYLSLIDKLNCGYCTYMNALFAYMLEVGHRTEYYWCGVKHCNQPNNPAFAYQDKFAEYGSEEDYRQHLITCGRRPA